MGDYVGAYQYCKDGSTAFASIVRVSLSFVGEGQAATEEAMMGDIQKVNSQLQTRINYLSVIGVCTPMVGLLGTIFGLIQAFAAVSAADPEAKGRILASGIAMAMNTTAFGLIVAIPQLIVHSFLTSKADGLIDDIDRYSVMVINMLAQARKEA